jgi:hypothetical protein
VIGEKVAGGESGGERRAKPQGHVVNALARYLRMCVCLRRKKKEKEGPCCFPELAV